MQVRAQFVAQVSAFLHDHRRQVQRRQQSGHLCKTRRGHGQATKWIPFKSVKAKCNHDGTRREAPDMGQPVLQTFHKAIIASAALVEQVPYLQRLVLEDLQHPLLEELETIGGGAILAKALAPPHDDLIAQQLLELKGEADGSEQDQSDLSGPSTARESTF